MNYIASSRLIFLFLFLMSLFVQPSFSKANSLLSDEERVTAYFSGNKGWIEIPKKELQKNQEFLCDNHLCYFDGKLGLLRMNPNVDIELLPEADRSYDKKNWRFPNSTDVVRFINKSYKHVRHDRMGSIQIDDRFFFQGKLYEVISDTESPTELSIHYTGVVLSRVVKTFKHTSNILVELTMYDSKGQESVIIGTRDHPFFVPEVNKYIPMGKLVLNTVLETDDGSLATVKNVKNLYGESTVYNLEVEDTHNFYVTSPSGGPIVNVHNTCECNEGLRLSDEARELHRAGKTREALDVHYEDLVRKKTGGTSEIINGRQIDSVTNDALIEAKRVHTAIKKPKNFLSKSKRKQIKELVKSANESGKKAEVWFKYGVSPQVRKWIEKHGGIVKTGLGD